MPSLADALQAEIQRLTDAFTMANQDGLHGAALPLCILECVEALAHISERFQDIPKPKRTRQVVRAAKQLYFSLDPDLPLLPEFLEGMVEHALLDLILPALVAKCTGETVLRTEDSGLSTEFRTAQSSALSPQS